MTYMFWHIRDTQFKLFPDRCICCQRWSASRCKPELSSSLWCQLPGYQRGHRYLKHLNCKFWQLWICNKFANVINVIADGMTKGNFLKDFTSRLPESFLIRYVLALFIVTLRHWIGTHEASEGHAMSSAAKAWFKRRILHAPNQILILVQSNEEVRLIWLKRRMFWPNKLVDDVLIPIGDVLIPIRPNIIYFT